MFKFTISAVFSLSLLAVTFGQNFNDVFDATLAGIMEENKADFNPLVVPDMARGITVHSIIRDKEVLTGLLLSHLKLYGVSSLKRTGDVSMTTVSNGGTRASLKFAIRRVKFEGTAHAKILGLGTSRSFEGQVGHLDAKVTINFSSKGKPSVSEVTLNELEGIELRLKEWWLPSSMIFNLKVKAITRLAKTIVKISVEIAMRRILVRVLENERFMDMIG